MYIYKRATFMMMKERGCESVVNLLCGSGCGFDRLGRPTSSLPNPDRRAALVGCQGCVEGMDKRLVRDELWKHGGAVYLSVSVSMRQVQYCLPYWICYAMCLGCCFSQP